MSYPNIRPPHAANIQHITTYGVVLDLNGFEEDEDSATVIFISLFANYSLFYQHNVYNIFIYSRCDIYLLLHYSIISSSLHSPFYTNLHTHARTTLASLTEYVLHCSTATRTSLIHCLIKWISHRLIIYACNRIHFLLFYSACPPCG